MNKALIEQIMKYVFVITVSFLLGFYLNSSDKSTYFNFDSPAIVKEVVNKGVYCEYKLGTQSEFSQSKLKLKPVKSFCAPCNRHLVNDTINTVTKKYIKPVYDKSTRTRHNR